MIKAAHSARPGIGTRREHSAGQSHITWEVTLSTILLLALHSRDARLAWFEAEDRRKALEIDRRARAAGERRRAA
jgi:hypothetical protein